MMKRKRLPSVRPTTRRERIALDRELKNRFADSPKKKNKGKSKKELKGADELTEIWDEDLCE